MRSPTPNDIWETVAVLPDEEKLAGLKTCQILITNLMKPKPGTEPISDGEAVDLDRLNEVIAQVRSGQYKPTEITKIVTKGYGWNPASPVDRKKVSEVIKAGQTKLQYTPPVPPTVLLP